MLSAASMKYGALQFLNQAISKYWVVNDNLAGQLGISVWYFVLLLVIVTILLVIRELNKPKKLLLLLLPNIKEFDICFLKSNIISFGLDSSLV